MEVSHDRDQWRIFMYLFVILVSMAYIFINLSKRKKNYIRKNSLLDSRFLSLKQRPGCESVVVLVASPLKRLLPVSSQY